MRNTQIFASAFLLTAAYAHGQATHLPETLKKLNETSAQFKSAEANVHRVLSQNFLGEKTETIQDGMLYVEGKGAKTELGIVITGKEARSVHFKNGVLRAFNPNPSPGTCSAIPSKGGQAESFFSVGFGGSGDDLQKEWNITDLGPETLSSDGKPVPVERLALVPKSQTVKNNFTNVTIWVDLSRGIALKQVLVALSGDTTTATYSKIRLNHSIDKKPFEFNESLCK